MTGGSRSLKGMPLRNYILSLAPLLSTSQWPSVEQYSFTPPFSHDVLPYLRLTVIQPAVHGLSPWNRGPKLNFSSSKFTCQVFWSQEWKADYHRKGAGYSNYDTNEFKESLKLVRESACYMILALEMLLPKPWKYFFPDKNVSWPVTFLREKKKNTLSHTSDNFQGSSMI